VKAGGKGAEGQGGRGAEESEIFYVCILMNTVADGDLIISFSSMH
jgi:hypothetical protein